MADETHDRFLTATRTLGAVALLVIGALHYQQYRHALDASTPRSAPLYLANFIIATGLGLVLLVPSRSRLKPNGQWLDGLVARVGLGVAAGGLAATLISEHTPVFGFMEHGYGFAVLLAITLDVAAVTTLTLFIVRARTAPVRSESQSARPRDPVRSSPLQPPSPRPAGRAAEPRPTRVPTSSPAALSINTKSRS